MQLGLKFYLIMIADTAVATECQGRLTIIKKKLPFRLYSSLTKLGVGRDNFF